ncbi:MAG: tyrosine-type recombinase/integrase [Syntrophales bacterium]
MCSQITREMVQKFILERSKVSPHTANHDLRYLRATFNYGKEMGHILVNPTDRIKYLPVEKRLRRVPSPEEIDKVVAAADPDSQDYLCAIRDTLARVSEINRLEWQDVNLAERYVVLYTRKKRGGHLTPRKVPMTGRLYDILSRRYERREKGIPWVFWHRYYSRKEGRFVEGPFKDRGRLMKDLCEKAGVDYFRYHPLRHSGASIMENNLVPTTAIQKILGHENRTTTEIYLHSLGGMERAAIEKYEEAVGAEKSTHSPPHIKAQGVRQCA